MMDEDDYERVHLWNRQYEEMDGLATWPKDDNTRDLRSRLIIHIEIDSCPPSSRIFADLAP